MSICLTPAVCGWPQNEILLRILVVIPLPVDEEEDELDDDIEDLLDEESEERDDRVLLEIVELRICNLCCFAMFIYFCADSFWFVAIMSFAIFVADVIIDEWYAFRSWNSDTFIFNVSR